MIERFTKALGVFGKLRVTGASQFDDAATFDGLATFNGGTSGVSGGGGASTPPGHAAHYIGTWDVAVAYAAGECVRQWDGAEFKLYQAKTATTGDDPTSVVASWAEVTTPIVMWGSENPLTTDSANANGGGIVAPQGSAYLYIDPDGSGGDQVNLGSPTSALWVSTPWESNGWSAASTTYIVPDDEDASIYSDIESYRSGTGDGNVFSGRYIFRGGAGSGRAYAPTQVSSGNGAGTGGGDAIASVLAEASGDDAGNASVAANAAILGAGNGNADARASASRGGTGTGIAYAGDTAIHHTGGEAHVIPTATDTAAFNDVKGDLVFTDNTEGPVIHDQSDGHTYRIVSTAGVLSTVLVT